MTDIREFGTALIDTQDLDPVYCAIWGAQLPGLQLCRLLFAYWCFYHLGAAAWLSEKEGADYWLWMKRAAVNNEPPERAGSFRWPRMPERRHFRGTKSVEAITCLSQWSPYDLVWGLTALKTDKEIMAKVQTWPMFGPWIAFKAADMMERCAAVPVDFQANIGLIYAEPRSALDILAEAYAPRKAEEWYEYLLHYFSDRLAPPRADRQCGPQEIETVLCKWKSHYRGHYWVGKDIHETRHALEGWGETAEKLLRFCPSEVKPPRKFKLTA